MVIKMKMMLNRKARIFFCLIIAILMVLLAVLNTGAAARDREIIHRPLGLFDEIEGNRIGTVYPQAVTVLYRHCDRWVLINSWLGHRWLDLEYAPSTSRLDRMLSRFGNNISVYYKNIETGFTYQYNAEGEYFGASVSKAMLALYFYTLAEQGEICLDTRVEFQSHQQNWGSGIIQQRYPVGTRFTLRRLLELNLSYSDNVATLMLRDYLGGQEAGVHRYRQFVASIGGDPGLVRDRIMNSRLTANEAGLFARAIYDYIESGGRYSGEFRRHLLNNHFPFLTLVLEEHPPTASKTGWSNDVLHDMAIVYADSHFILVVMSSGLAGTQYETRQTHDDFALIYQTFLEFNNRWFPGYLCLYC